MEHNILFREIIIFSIMFYFVGGILYNAIIDDDKEIKAKH